MDHQRAMPSVHGHGGHSPFLMLTLITKAVYDEYSLFDCAYGYKRTLVDIENPHREFLTAGEVAEFLGVSKSTYYKQKDTFPFRILRIGKKMFIPKQAFVEYMKREKQFDLWRRRDK